MRTVRRTTSNAGGFFLRGKALLFVFLLTVTAWPSLAAEPAAPKPGPKDKCPVCGMFVAKYPDWVAAVVFHDGAALFFDGVKDLMKFRLRMERFGRGRKPEEIRAVFVTDYYRLEPIDGLRAFYVLGSDVLGPMGRELIPFEREEEAREFMKDHRGEEILRFEQIDTETLKRLD